MSTTTTTRIDPPLRVVGRPRLRQGWSTAVGMIVAAVFLLPAIVVGGAAFHVWSIAKVHQTTKSDAIVVLGAAQYNGTPSPVLAERLQHALNLWKSGTSTHIVTVGGKQPKDRFTEAQSGRQWLIDHGVPSGSVTAVDAGTDTQTSLSDVAALAQDRGWKSITIDSDPAHIARSAAIANRLGFKVFTNPTSSGDGSAVTATYLARETGGYLIFEIAQQWSVARTVGSA